MAETQPADASKAVLGEHVDRYVASGHRIESRSDHVVTLVAGRPVNHLLHAILSIFTAGLWITIWVIVTLTGGERTVTLSVNSDGSVRTVSRRRLGTGARIALSILLALDILAILLVALFIVFAVSTVADAVDSTSGAQSIPASPAVRTVTSTPAQPSLAQEFGCQWIMDTYRPMSSLGRDMATLHVANSMSLKRQEAGQTLGLVGSGDAAAALRECEAQGFK